jgi:hypothetical protein
MADIPENPLLALGAGVPIEEQERVYGDKGWFFKAWIPIETRLFSYRDTIAFRLEVNGWVGNEDTGGMLKATTDFFVSSLRQETELGLDLDFGRASKSFL